MTGKWICVNKIPVLDLRYRVSGLFEGNTYEFRVFAENVAGISEPSFTSDPIKATRAITKPGPPGNLKLKDWSKSYADICWTKPTRDGGSPILGYKSCMVSWENPEDNGGTEITQYVIECRQPSQRAWTVVSNDCTKRLFKAPLTEGCEYFFRVSAENKIGVGPPSETKSPIVAVDPIEKPGEPVDFQIAEIGKTFCYLKWKKPDYDGGSRNLAYHIEKKPKEAEEWERLHKGTYHKVKGLLKGNEYVFRVLAVNKYGVGEALESENIKVTDPYTRPTAPTGVDVTSITGDSMTINWYKPASDGGSPVTGYVIERREKTGMRWIRVNRDIVTECSTSNLNKSVCVIFCFLFLKMWVLFLQRRRRLIQTWP
uniref:Fibronectin type-III domain-containing protein n=1 Tax=Cynoglossus semilaevis TaxID=244447 RepID=A0A3P8WE38_CYNSE